MTVNLEPVKGTKWIRSNNASLLNPYGGIPTIIFEQEIMSTFEDGVTQSLGGTSNIRADLTNPTETFNLINPIDNSIIGSATYQDVYILLASLYAYIATK